MTERRLLTDTEKEQVRLNFKNRCYLCESSLDGYDGQEVEYDHIYAYADGYPQELSNFAPVHASRQPGRRNCHQDKGRKSPYEYKEELRIQQAMEGVTGLKDLCGQATPGEVQIDYMARKVTFSGQAIPLYSQRLDGRDHWYFYHEVPLRNIANDDRIQLRPLEPKIYPLIAHLRHTVQLLPSLGRLDTHDNIIRIFDGQHKAVAQIIGNQREVIPCIVFVDPDVDDLRVTVFEAHTSLIQQRYKRSHIADKLATIYEELIAAYRETLGNPNAPYTEAAILRGETRAAVRNFVRSQIIDELRSSHPFIDNYVAEDRRQQRGPRAKPMIWQTLELFVNTFAQTNAVETTSEEATNYREEEIENLSFLLNLFENHMITSKWNPAIPDSEQHRLARKFFYEKACGIWIKTLEKALRTAFDQMEGRAHPGPLCYRPAFSGKIRERFNGIVHRLVVHGVWMNPAHEATIAGAYEKDIEELFSSQGIDYVYLTAL